MHPAAPFDQGAEGKLPCGMADQRSRSHRAVKSLVPGDADHVRSQIRDVDGDVPRRLGAICDHQEVLAIHRLPHGL